MSFSDNRVWRWMSRRCVTLKSTTPGNRVIKQHSFRSHNNIPCLPSEVADQLIDDPTLLLERLNAIFGTNHSFYSRGHWREIMEYCIDRGYDLGMTYGMLRSRWSYIPQTSILSELKALESKDSERRDCAVINGLVHNRMMPPRRVWDLYSNRVLPFWSILATAEPSEQILAVSHAWMCPEKREGVQTRINGGKWPVPIPRGISLDDLRIELLNFSQGQPTAWAGHAEYVWLDALCLRQAGGAQAEEALRTKEWEIDVPTIGSIYQHCESTVIYLNGLGRPFEENDLDSKRHWCNRAWTMQEWCLANTASSIVLLGGVTKRSPAFDIMCKDRIEGSGFAARLNSRMPRSDARDALRNIFPAAAMMNKRQAENEIDRIGGLAYLTCANTQPAYNASQEVDDAWLSFIACLTSHARGRLFYRFPAAGDGKWKWMPSWHQLLAGAEEAVAYDPENKGYSHFNEEISPTLTKRTALPDPLLAAQPAKQSSDDVDQYTCLAVCLPNCHLKGFDGPTFASGSHYAPRRGTVTFHVPLTGSDMTIELTAHHRHPIPDSCTYYLLTTVSFNGLGILRFADCRDWVVGSMDDEQRFHKISVLTIDEDGDFKISKQLTETLHLLRKRNDDNADGLIRRIRLA